MTTSHITKIAALPSGGGHAAHPAPEVAAASPKPAPNMVGVAFDPSEPHPPIRTCTCANCAPSIAEEGPMVYVPSIGRSITVPPHPLFKTETPADRQGFEPFDYAERS